jgi:hypothetical protein
MALAALPLPRTADGRIVLAVDVSNWLRPDAGTSAERLFCHVYARGKGQAQMIPGWPYSIVAGPGVYICDGCVALAQQIVAEPQSVETDRTQLQHANRTSKARCSFCGKAARDVTSLVMGPGVRICDRCLRLCGEILTGQ